MQFIKTNKKYEKERFRTYIFGGKKIGDNI